MQDYNADANAIPVSAKSRKFIKAFIKYVRLAVDSNNELSTTAQEAVPACNDTLIDVVDVTADTPEAQSINGNDTL